MSSEVPTPRHALGWPPGSVRAMLALMIVGLVCALMLIPPREGEPPTPIPVYLRYLLFLVLGDHFAARGSTRDQPRGLSHQPLYLPRGCVRLLMLGALTATCVYRYMTDPASLEKQWLAPAQSLHEALVLPMVVLLSFFAGTLLRMLFGHHSWAWIQDLEAWLSLIAVLLLAVAALIHLVINVSLPQDLDPTFLQGILAAVVAFYFGERS